jgi:Asp-tRNA(Asn)/Glu-tRNA(Gln) amidotransferase A subunit family amidase
VEDAARVFNIIAGFDPADPLTRKAIKQLPSDYTQFLRKDGLKDVHLGVLRALSNTETEDPEILALFEQAILDLRRLGAIVVDPVEIKDFAKQRAANDFCSAFLWDVNKYFQSLGPKAPVVSFMQIIRSGQYHPSSKWGIDWVNSTKIPPEQQNPPCLGVEEDPRRAAFLAAALATMDEQKIDAIIYPTWNNPPRKVGDLDSPHGNNSSVISPHTGQPSITVPMGFTTGNLPAGLQLLGRPFEEAKLFQYAYAYEQATHHRKPPELFAE